MCRLADWLEAHPDVGVAGPRIRNADGTVQPSARRFPDFTTAIAGRSSWLTKALPWNPLSRHNLPARDLAEPKPVEVDWVSGACMCIRRKAFDAVGGLDEGFFLYWEDADFCRRLQHAGWRTMFVPEAIAVHIGARSSRHAADASLEAFHHSAYRLYRKHASPAGQLLAPARVPGLQLRLAFMKRLVRRTEVVIVSSSEVDAVVIGAGVVGLACAAEIAAQGRTVCLLERHGKPGLDTSTHNSGVVHAGIYYPPGTLKATALRRGQATDVRVLRAPRRAACAVRQTDRCGRRRREPSELEALHARGIANDVEELALVDAEFVGKREPHVRATAALWSGSTGVVEARSVRPGAQALCATRAT